MKQAGINGISIISPCLPQQWDQWLSLMAVEPLGLVTGFVPLCPDLQVASVVSQSGCASPVPFPRGCSEQALCTKVAVGLCPSRKFGQLVEKLGGGRYSFFSLGNQIKVREQQETQEFMQTSQGELGKLPSLIKLKNYTEKRYFPVAIVHSPSPSCRVEG